MMNKRTLKKSINAICDEIFAEAVALSLYGNDRNMENDDALIRSVIMLRANYISRISHQSQEWMYRHIIRTCAISLLLKHRKL